jgi:hypothetical protein
LRRFLEQVADPALSASGLERLDRLEAARDAAGAASHRDLAGFLTALQDLDQVFTEVTGAAPSRHGGQAYGGRTLVYHDSRRDAELVLGADFQAALEPLDMLLTSARWLTYHFAAWINEVITSAADRLADRGGPVDLASLCVECVPAIHREAAAKLSELQHESRRLWAAILDVPPDVPRVQLDGAALRERVRAAFDAPHPGWAAARYCTVDLLIAANGVDAINRGDFELILGELHVAISSIRHAAFVGQHPALDELIDCLAVDFPEPRLLPVLPSEVNDARLTCRTHPALIRDEDFLVELAHQTTDAGRPRLLRSADLIVTRGPAGPVVTVPDGSGRLSFPVIDVLSELLVHFVIDSFPLLSPSAHQPRITVDRLVIARETWRFQASQLGFAQVTDEPARFAAARRWLRDEGMPNQVFVRIPGEVKPFLTDFDSIVSVNLLAKSVRRLQAADDQESLIQIGEVLPTSDQLWMTDADGDIYTSELRMVAVDQRDPSSDISPTA